MQLDFHYYATYCAAYIAGYTHEEALQIGYASQFVDCCTRTLLTKLHGPIEAATTQSQAELINARTDVLGLQNITRIWASFHFLPFDLYAKKENRSKLYMNKYRLICDTNSDLLVEAVNLSKEEDLQGVGIAMHVLADTWAHRYFAGTPSFVINNTDFHFTEIIQGETSIERAVSFRHNPVSSDNVETGFYVGSMSQDQENSIMNLGHGRAGHLPDYSFARYRYLPSWGEYKEVYKDNPKEYYEAFCQMVYAMRFTRNEIETFEKDTYDYQLVEPYQDRIKAILEKRQLDASQDWKAFGESLSGKEIEDFDITKYQQEYLDGQNKEETYLGKFFVFAIRQKSMVTDRIFQSGNLLAGISKQSLKGVIKDYINIQNIIKRKDQHE